MISIESAAEHREAVSHSDTIELIQDLAGLQLLPANAGRLLRLEGGVQSLASVPQTAASGRHITTSELRRWLNDSPFQVPEDPFNNSFSEELTFVGGSYRVLPGAVEGSSYLFRRLATAIFRSGTWGAEHPFRRDATTAAVAVLRVSDAVTRRADIGRGVRPGLGELVVPAARDLEPLRNAVTFDEDELREVLAGVPPDVLDSFTQELGLPLTANPEHLGTGPFYARPLLRSENTIIVGLPHALLGALLHRIVVIAVEHGETDALAQAFRASVMAASIESLGYVECPQVYVPLSDPPDGFADAVFRLDRDKALYLLAVTDPLVDYDAELIYGQWRDDSLRERIEERLLAVESELLLKRTPPNAVMHLILLQSLGRTTMVGFGERLPPARSYRLVMSAADLEVISLLEGGNALTLWQYACC